MYLELIAYCGWFFSSNVYFVWEQVENKLALASLYCSQYVHTESISVLFKETFCFI